jgi:hypothetical protein
VKKSRDGGEWSCAEIRVGGIFGARFAAVGFGHINDDSPWRVILAVGLAVDGRERAEEQTAGIGHDGGAASEERNVQTSKIMKG